MFDRSDRYVGLGFIVLGALGIFSASQWKVLYSADPAGPTAIPIILCVGIIIMGAILLVGGLFVKKTADDKVIATKKEIILVTAIALSSLLYIMLLSVLGYLIMTPLYVASILVLVGSLKPKTVVLISVITTLVLFIMFYSLLRVNLPLGFMRGFISSFVPRL